MKPIVLTDVLAVGEFPTSDQLAILAKAGFKSIINNQPDGEVERFRASAALEAEARRLGLAYAYVPIVSRVVDETARAAFADALKSLPDPIYAFCYSGARSAAACAFAMTASHEVTEIIAELERGGFDVRALAPWLEDERARHSKARPAATGGSNGSAGALGSDGASVKARAVDGSGHASGKGRGIGPHNITASSQPSVEPAATRPVPKIVQLPRAAGFSGYAL